MKIGIVCFQCERIKHEGKWIRLEELDIGGKWHRPKTQVIVAKQELCDFCKIKLEQNILFD